MSYDANQLDLIREVGVDYVGRILKGASQMTFQLAANEV